MSEDATITCPLCELPHLAAATHCDDCGQDLHRPINLRRLRGEARRLQQTVYVAAGLCAAALVGSFLLVSVIGGAFLLLAPFGWGFSAWWRLRILKRQLGRLERRS